MLTKESDGYRAQVGKMQDSINTLLAKYQKDEPTMTAAQKETKQKALQAMGTDFQAMQARLQQTFNQHQAAVMGPIQDLVKKVLDDIRQRGRLRDDPRQLAERR